MSNRIYAACLASYNNGVLHGEWIDASTDVDEMQERVNAMLRASKFPNVTVTYCEYYPTTCATLCRHNDVKSYWPVYIAGKFHEVPSAEEWAIHDHEGAALQSLQEYSGLKRVATLVELEELAESELGDDGMAIVAAYWDNVGTMPDDAQEAVDAARDAYAGTFDNREAFAEEYAESTGLLDSVPESLRSYFDMDAFARDLLIGDYFENDGHYFHNC